MQEDRPVYRAIVRGRWKTVFADTGDPLERLTEAQATAVARRFAETATDHALSDTRIVEPDQWTLENRGMLPMHRVVLGDASDTQIYVSEQTGQAVLETTRSSRRLAYAGAVLHWIYFTPFRKQSALWAQSIVWLSLVGSIMCLLGLVWGLWRVSPGSRYRLKREPSWSPYSGSMRWHHYAGLLFGLTTFTWVFSGMLSMDPWDWHPSTAPTRAQREVFSGGAWRLDQVSAESIQRGAAALAAASAAPAKELEVVQFKGEPFLSDQTHLVSIGSGGSKPFEVFDRDTMLATAREAMPSVAVEDAVWLDAYDSYYYDRDGELSLPVLRVRYVDPQRSWLYVDPRRGAIVRKEERLTRLNRWLYHGLHSLDFPFLYYRRPLWDIVVIVLSLGGLASTITAVLPAFRRLRRHWRRVTS